MSTAMKISINPYRRRDGSLMVYLNNDRGVSLGLSAEHGYQSSKASAGQAKLWQAFCAATRETADIAIGANMDSHAEWSMTLFNGVSFAITDVASVGGVPVGADGLYVVRDGRVMPAKAIAADGGDGRWFATVEA